MEQDQSPATCLDAGTLAAFIDGTLSPAERAAAETHAADCDRCLAVLAAIARTTPPPSREQARGAAAAQRPAWLSVRWLVPLASAAAVIVAIVLVQAPREAERHADAPAPAVMAPPQPAAPVAQPEADTTAKALKDERQTNAAPLARQSRARTEARRSDEPAAKDSAAAAVPAPPPPAPERLQSQTRATMQEQPVIVSPDPNVRWRIAGATVERSADGGRTWQAQLTDASVDFLAGTSPSSSVCWLVGRRGAVLLSADGQTWRRLEFPDMSVELVAVTARDARSATVTTADGRTYRTEDGGRTWALQEKPGAAF